MLFEVSILVNPYNRPHEWMAALAALLPDERLILWPDVGDSSVVELLVAWRMPRAALAELPNLQAILSLGAGGDQWLIDGMPDVPIVRLADPAMSEEMAAYALHWVIRLQRHFGALEDQQRRQVWQILDHPPPSEFRIGVLGYGTIGSRIGDAFGDLGYAVNGWSRSDRDSGQVSHYVGLDELADFLAASDAVINVLPNTPATTGLLGVERFAQFKPGSVFVNIGRGNVLDEDALIAAVEDGPLRAAVLDVTDPEPPDADSPLWHHPGIHLTPHVAGSTQIRTASRLVAANVDRIRSGEYPFPLLDRTRGY